MLIFLFSVHVFLHLCWLLCQFKMSFVAAVRVVSIFDILHAFVSLRFGCIFGSVCVRICAFCDLGLGAWRRGECERHHPFGGRAALHGGLRRSRGGGSLIHGFFFFLLFFCFFFSSRFLPSRRRARRSRPSRRRGVASPASPPSRHHVARPSWCAPVPRRCWVGSQGSPSCWIRKEMKELGQPGPVASQAQLKNQQQ